MALRSYDFVMIGGGVAGLVAASGAARFGAKVAIVEKASLGGDCLRTGCVPTKRLIRSAKVASIIRRASEFGMEVGSFRVDFPRVMERMRQVQAEVGERDDPKRFMKMGVDVIFGSGSFTGPDSFQVNGDELSGRKFLIATGSSPVMLPIPGLSDSGALTNETALELERLPDSIAILGGGPIGIEFAQVFARLGSEVTVIERMDQILPREDKELSDALQEVLEAEGIRIEVCTEIKKVERQDNVRVLYASCPTGDKVYRAEQVMVAIGRSPNVKGLGLEAAGVEFDARKGIRADEHLRTSQPAIYAAGDVVGPYLFTHVAEHHAGVALSNLVLPLMRRKVDYGVVPWATFSDPELARVGMTEKEATEAHGQGAVKAYRFSFGGVDRAVIDGEPAGLVKLVCDGKKRIVGAHVLGPRAGELIHEYVLAMKKGVPITEISQTMHIYPTDSMALKRAADEYYRVKLFTGWVPKAARWLVRRAR